MTPKRQSKLTRRLEEADRVPVDNDAKDAKLYLRRYFLDKYHHASRFDHVDGHRRPNVLDCCQAEGVLWGELRRDYDVRYLGVDRTVKKGRLAMDSTRILAFPRLPYQIIDVDTYGSPWRHWDTLLPNLIGPTTVFLTLGRIGGSLATVDAAVMQALGLDRLSRKPPQTLRWKIDKEAVASCFARCYHYGVRILEAQEVLPAPKSARYFGVHLIPSTAAREHSP